MNRKKALLLLLLMIYPLNTPTPVNAQEPSDEQNNLLQDSFSSDFEFENNIVENSSMDGVLLAAASAPHSSCCACACQCQCQCQCECECQCQCQCVSHCGTDTGLHSKPLYHFYDFISNSLNLGVTKSTLDGNYKNDFEKNNRMTAPTSDSQFAGIQYTVYTPIFNYYTGTNYTYHEITDPITFTGNFHNVTGATSDTTATYYDDFNTISFYTSKYTQKVEIKIIGQPADADHTEVITLTRNLNATTGAPINNNLAVSGADAKIIVNSAAGANNATQVGDVIQWTFSFKLKTYGLFGQPLPNAPYQTGIISIEDAWDFNNKSYSESSKQVTSSSLGLSEDVPNSINFYVRQPKFSNFKILKVNDIYWKDFVPTSGGKIGVNGGTIGEIPNTKAIPTLPLNINPINKRHISLGYLVEFSIDSTDFDGSYFSDLTIIPSFKCGIDNVNLFYDQPSNKKYNIAVTQTNDSTNHTNYAKIILGFPTPNSLSSSRHLSAEKIVGTEIIKKEVSLPSNPTGKEDKKTWKFIYYLPPTTKAFPSSITDPSIASTVARKKGLVEVNFSIIGSLVGNIYSTNNAYDFTSKAKSGEGLGGDGVFYYNLDWNALNDYSTQQR